MGYIIYEINCKLVYNDPFSVLIRAQKENLFSSYITVQQTNYLAFVYFYFLTVQCPPESQWGLKGMTQLNTSLQLSLSLAIK